MRIGKF